MHEYIEHLPVVLEHDREQLSNADASGEVKEMLQEQRRRASMLIVVGNDESHLGTVRAGSYANESTDGDESLASSFPNRQCQANVIVEIQLGGLPEGARGESRQGAEEPLVNGLRG
jgi:hypothetical protein